MAIRTGIWRIDGSRPKPLEIVGKDREDALEAVLADDISIVSGAEAWLVIGTQVQTHSGPLDILAMDADGNLVVVELKRDKSTREVVSQTLDYAAWVKGLEDYSAVAEVWNRWASRRGDMRALEVAFRERFGKDIDPESVNSEHRMVIVATSLHPEAERVARYLIDSYGMPINVLFFSVFHDNGAEYLSTSWLEEPVEPSSPAVRNERKGYVPQGPWNGEYYMAFVKERDKVLAGLEHGFIGAEGPEAYTSRLARLPVGSRVWVMGGQAENGGYVGVGRVLGPPVPAAEFTVEGPGGTTIPADGLPGWSGTSSHAGGPGVFVPIEWEHVEHPGHWEHGFFANQNLVSEPKAERWARTVERLAELWGVEL